MPGENRDQVDAEGQLSSLGQVMGELVHDLANEVTVLHGWALLARGEAEAGRLPTAETQRVVEISAGLGQMLRDVLATVSGQALSPEVTFDPRRATEEVLERRVRVLSGKTVRLHCLLPPEVRVPGRPSFWSRVLGNLLGNAGRHARRRIDIKLCLEEGGGRRLVVLRVEDDGAGVEPHRRQEMFRPFVRGDDGGTGLGLSSVAWAVTQLRGEVRYANDSALGGAAFEVRVPAVAPLVAPPAPDPDAGAESLAGLRLLLVDDDHAVRVALARLLRRVGVEVRDLDPDGEPEERLLQAIVGTTPEVVLLDLRLGERGGISLWRRMRDEVPRLARQVAFVTGAAPGESDWREAEATGQPVLSKPFGLQQLGEVVERLRARE